MLKDGWDELDNGVKGDWAFFNDDAMIIVKYGDHIAALAFLYIRDAPKGYPQWQWDGNREAPTLSPSILVRGPKGQPDIWHGYLIAGKLKEA
jgi:hypothetical protein